MKKKFMNQTGDKAIIGLFLFSILSILGITVGYSALNTELSISGDAYVRVNEDIRITDLKMVEATNGAYETYNNKYSKDTTNVFVTLPNENSTITFQVTVENRLKQNFILKEIKQLIKTNPNIQYELIGINVNNIYKENKLTFSIKLSYIEKMTSSDNKEILNLQWVFQIIESLPLDDLILDNNPIIKTAPTLTTSFNETTDQQGLYESKKTNSGLPTYYFRGNVENNYVLFADKLWRIIRINEDRTIRVIMAEGINNNEMYSYNSTNNNPVEYLYYHNSLAKKTLDLWYNQTLLPYEGIIATENYCGEVHALQEENYKVNNLGVYFKNYTPTFECRDTNYLYNLKIGLITYDELVFAGGYSNGNPNNNFYLHNHTHYWSMSPSGYISLQSSPTSWAVSVTGYLGYGYHLGIHMLRPVINLKTNATVSGGDGTISNPYVISEL